MNNQLRFMGQYFNVIAVSADEGDLKEVEEKEGVQTFDVKLTRKITPIVDLAALWKLYWFLKKEKPSIVHTHTPKAGLIGMMAAWLANVPVRMHTVAGLPLLETKGLKRWVLNVVEKITYACAQNVYPNSKGLKKIIIESNFCKPAKLKVIANGSSNGIDTAYFSDELLSVDDKLKVAKSLNFQKGDFVFCYVGRMVGDKGTNELVEAFLSLHTDYSHIKLLLVGPFENELDPLEPVTEQFIKTHPAIKWTNYQNDVRPYLALSHAFVFPTYREGFPNGPMQAGCFNLPSIVTDINGCNEIIVHKQNGLIIPPKNCDALKAAMLLLLSDKALYETCRQNARRMIVQRFNQMNVWEELLKEYQTLAGEPKLSSFLKTA